MNVIGLVWRLALALTVVASGGRAAFHTARLVSKEAKARNYRLVIPVDTTVRLPPRAPESSVSSGFGCRSRSDSRLIRVDRCATEFRTVPATAGSRAVLSGRRRDDLGPDR